jgi:hypothetical protein
MQWNETDTDSLEVREKEIPREGLTQRHRVRRGRTDTASASLSPPLYRHVNYII